MPTLASLQPIATLAASAAVLFVGFQVFRTGEKVSKVVGDNLNPVDPDNIVNRGVTRIVKDITGKPDKKLGDVIFQFLNPEEAERLCKAGVTKFCSDASEQDTTSQAAVLASDKFFLTNPQGR